MGGPLGAAAAAAAGQLGQLGQHTYVVTKGELDPPSWQHRLYHNIFLQTKKVYHNSNNYWQHQNSAETYPKTLTMNIKKTNQGQVRGGRTSGSIVSIVEDLHTHIVLLILCLWWDCTHQLL